jgi:hypothetical protein
MPSEEVRVIDSGTTLKMAVKRPDGTDFPMEGYIVLQYKFQKPDGTIMTKDAELDDDGDVVYTTEDGDFDQVGTWLYQIYFEIGSFKRHTDYSKFKVHPNLPLS